ncbi:MAG TPA: PQQ-binding-like beta-propeller repeat protein, partial [Terriglobales bacterium]|nr:PQQ-binding-like beta-propeller repeat protein [Terriglobales bacterium]
VYMAGSDDTIYAIDAEVGEIVWQKQFKNPVAAKDKATFQCGNSLNATPVIDKQAGIIYVSTSDGKLRGLSLTNGEERMPATNFTDPYSRNWSLNLIDGVIYSSTGRGCGGAVAHFMAMDLKTRQVSEFYTSKGRPSGAWGRGGLIKGPKGIYTQTADGPYDPASGGFGNSVMSLSFKNFRLLDTYTAANWEFLNKKDLDLGSANPSVFPFQKWTLVASASKESTVTLLDADKLGGSDHHTPLYLSPRWGNDEFIQHNRGVWGSMATWEDKQGRRWLLMPLWGPVSKGAPKFPVSYGSTDQGSIMAFEVLMDANKEKPTLAPVWISRDMHAPDPPVIANGVVYVLQTGKDSDEAREKGKLGATPKINAILYALDAETGKELYSSGKLIESWAHFSEPVVAGGRVYVATWDGKLYAFGLKK